MAQTESISRSQTYISLKSGSWMVTLGRGTHEGLGIRGVVLVLVVQERHEVAVRPVNGEEHQDPEVDGEESDLEWGHLWSS